MSALGKDGRRMACQPADEEEIQGGITSSAQPKIVTGKTVTDCPPAVAAASSVPLASASANNNLLIGAAIALAVSLYLMRS